MQLTTGENLLILSLQGGEQILTLRVRVVGQRKVISGLVLLREQRGPLRNEYLVYEGLYFVRVHFEDFLGRVEDELVLRQLGYIVQIVAIVKYDHRAGLFQLQFGRHEVETGQLVLRAYILGLVVVFVTFVGATAALLEIFEETFHGLEAFAQLV